MQQEKYIILVKPQLAQNIGHVARVMSNFGVCNLRIVSPRDGWPPEEIALDVASKGYFIINSAQVFSCVEDAISDLNTIYATASLKRDVHKEVISSYELPSRMRIANKIGVLFGCEKSGLTNEELSYASAMVTIPTSIMNHSLNIAQAVAIICYEFNKTEAPDVAVEICEKGEIISMISYLEDELAKTNYYKSKEIKQNMQINLRNLFAKAQLSQQEVNTLFGIFKHLRK
jgi:tRNA/rRNA methyltransferase